MTQAEAIALESCPACGAALMKVHSTGLVSCLAWLNNVACFWHVRVAPFDNVKQRERLTKKEQKMRELQDEINRRIAEAHEQST